jgi:hypothetical protein
LSVAARQPLALITADGTSATNATSAISGTQGTHGTTGTPAPTAPKPRNPSTSTTHLTGTAAEPFEYRYLDALSDEGVDVSVFLDGWCRAMDDDLARLCILRRRRSPPDHVSGLLHRLSGAAGLVGALSLMEALRRASASPLEQSTGSIDTLIDRTRNLVRQLETPRLAHRNTQP